MVKGSEIKPFDLSLYEDLHQKFLWKSFHQLLCNPTDQLTNQQTNRLR